MPIFKKCVFLHSEWLFQKWLRRANHYAHETRIKILCRTPVSILRDLSTGLQINRKTFKYSFLAWMSTWISKWRRRRWRRRRADNFSIWRFSFQDWSGSPVGSKELEMPSGSLLTAPGEPPDSFLRVSLSKSAFFLNEHVLHFRIVHFSMNPEEFCLNPNMK